MSRIILSDRGSFLGKSGEQFRITRKEEPEVLIPARGVEQILILGSGISVSSDAIDMANDLGVEIAFASYYGKPLARLIPASLGGTVKTRREQYYAYDDARGADLAKSFIRGKLRNQSSLLKSFAKKWKGEKQDLWQEFRASSNEIEALIPRLDQIKGCVEDVRERIMGVEGNGAEIYWRTWAKLIPDEWISPPSPRAVSRLSRSRARMAASPSWPSCSAAAARAAPSLLASSLASIFPVYLDLVPRLSRPEGMPCQAPRSRSTVAQSQVRPSAPFLASIPGQALRNAAGNPCPGHTASSPSGMAIYLALNLRDRILNFGITFKIVYLHQS